jgi:hypothetical protein
LVAYAKKGDLIMGSKRMSTGRIRKLIEATTIDILVQANLMPKTNGGGELGSASNRWADLFVQDLNLSNGRGDYTIIEEEEYLSIRNNKSGKLYKFVLEEIAEEEE